MRTVLKYPGSKQKIAKELVSFIPLHRSYVEPYFGSGAVFFNKDPSAIETINDLDNDIPNLFRCIRKDPERLSKEVAAIPYSRYEYEMAFREETADDFERAVTFLIKCWMGYGFRIGSRVGWKNDVHGREGMYALREWYKLPERILIAAERLRAAQIENRPALEVIRRFNYPDVFMYIDPPYLKYTRLSQRKQYKYEMLESEHIDLLEELQETDAMVMISGYESDLYNEMLAGWEKRYFRSNNEYGGTVMETVWMNFQPAMVQMTMERFLKEE